jgi:predicted amidohydrolase
VSELDLFAVQARISPKMYRSVDAFADATRRYVERCSAARREGTPALLVFPENYGSFLALTALGGLSTRMPTIDSAFALGVACRPLAFARALRRVGRAHPQRAALLTLTREIAEVYHHTFATLARAHGVTIVAGSALLEGDADDVYNASVTFAEDGSVAARTRKVNLVPDIEDGIGLTPNYGGSHEVALSAVGRVGTLICYDGFQVPHTPREPTWQPVGGTFEDEGVHIVAQPSANPWSWRSAWVHRRPGEDTLRCEQWAREGLQARLTQLEGVRFGVTAHLVGRVLDQRFEGLSAIYERDDAGEVRVLCQAAHEDTDAIVHARVAAPWLPMPAHR